MRMTNQSFKNSKLKKLLLLLAPLLLTTCSATDSNTCPSLRGYTPEEQDQLYIAISNLDAGSPIRSAMDDYDNLRRQVRACATGYND